MSYLVSMLECDLNWGNVPENREYFGETVKLAVIQFQEKYAAEVLAPWGITQGTGFAGETTRAKLNQLLGSGDNCFVPNGAIEQKWNQLKAVYPVGNPTVCERSAPDSPYGTTCMMADFEHEGMQIYWIREWDTAHEVHGAIVSVYKSMGGPSSRLGFPVSDEYADQNSPGLYRRSDFEGEYISWDTSIGGYTAFAEMGGDGLILRWPLSGNPDDRSISGYHFGDHWRESSNGGFCVDQGLENKKLLHTGVDYAASVGEEIRAAHAGKVVYQSLDTKWGGYVVTESHDKTFTVTYIHVIPLVNNGADVIEGQVIGTIADISPYPSHLHFQLRTGGYDLTWSLRGRLPEVRCDARKGILEPAFPENFIDPKTLNWR